MNTELTTTRNHSFDTFRGLLMISIPIWHFSKCAGDWYSDLYQANFSHSSILGFVYLLLNIFVMQGFAFISGYFSKNPEKAKTKAFSDALVPYIMFTVVAIILELITGQNVSNDEPFLKPTFALWFLLCLFIWKITLPYVTKFKWALPVSIGVMLFAGMMPFHTFLSLQRMISFYPFFLLGFYCKKEWVEKIRNLRKHPTLLIGIISLLLIINFILLKVGPSFEWYHLSKNTDILNISAGYDISMRFIMLILACSWISVILALIPKRETGLSIIGKNTMPIYVFHIIFRQLLRFSGLYVCSLFIIIAAVFSYFSYMYNKTKNKGYVIAEMAIMTMSIILFINSNYNFMDTFVPENKIALYIMVYGSAFLLSITLIAPCWKKLYETIVFKKRLSEILNPNISY